MKNKVLTWLHKDGNREYWKIKATFLETISFDEDDYFSSVWDVEICFDPNDDCPKHKIWSGRIETSYDTPITIQEIMKEWFTACASLVIYISCDAKLKE